MLALFVLCVLAGCGSSPKEMYYTLSAGETMNNNVALASGESTYSVAVGPITLPEVVDRPQLVLRVGPNEVTFEELHRWAGSLRSEIPRIIADNLAGYLNVKQVAAYPQNAGEDAEYRVLADIQRFDATLGESVAVHALWSVRRSSDGAVQTGQSLAKESITGMSYEAVVAAHSRALAIVSRDIAEAIRSVSTRSLP
jgi:uncharacterized lipoprotein YmbA